MMSSTAVVPMVRESCFTVNGQEFSTGGYAYWDQQPDSGSVSNVTWSGALTNIHANLDTYATWLETTFDGPGYTEFLLGEYKCSS